MKQSSRLTLPRLSCYVLCLALGLMSTATSQAAFHLWNIQEIYTNSSGTLQFIEFQTSSGSQQFVNGQQINVTNLANTITNMFTIPSNLPSDSTNHTFLVGTAGIQAAGAPAPDFIIPAGFLFQAGGTINFFGANSGGYTALPTDGTLSRIWNGGNQVNSPTNFAGITGTIAVPEPAAFLLIPLALGAAYLVWLRRRRVIDVEI